MAQELWTAEQVCEHLKVGRARLWELQRSGELPGVRIGRRRLWRQEDIDALVQRRIDIERDAAGALR